MFTIRCSSWISCTGSVLRTLPLFLPSQPREVGGGEGEQANGQANGSLIGLPCTVRFLLLCHRTYVSCSDIIARYRCRFYCCEMNNGLLVWLAWTGWGFGRRRQLHNEKWTNLFLLCPTLPSVLPRQGETWGTNIAATTLASRRYNISRTHVKGRKKNVRRSICDFGGLADPFTNLYIKRRQGKEGGASWHSPACLVLLLAPNNSNSSAITVFVVVLAFDRSRSSSISD